MTELAAIEAAMGSLKSHGGTYHELQAVLGEPPHTARKIVKACAELLKRRGHNACAESLLRLEFIDAPSA